MLGDALDHDCDGWAAREGSACQSAFIASLPLGPHVQLAGCGDRSVETSLNDDNPGQPVIAGSPLSVATSADAAVRGALTITVEDICGTEVHGITRQGTGSSRILVSSLSCDSDLLDGAVPCFQEGSLDWTVLEAEGDSASLGGRP